MPEFRTANRATFVPRFGGVDTEQWELRIFCNSDSLWSDVFLAFEPNHWEASTTRKLGGLGFFPGTWLRLRSGGWETTVSHLRPS